jgi:hypothetical protein
MTIKRHILSKSTFIRGMQCPKSLYLHKKRPFLRDKISAEQLAKFKRGTDVGVLARELFPGGVDMTPQSPSQYQKKVMETADALKNEAIDIIYEAVFQYDDTLIMLDILVRDGGAWKAYEVKSSRALSLTYYTDAALQYYVLTGAGIPLSDFCLVYINKDYVLDNVLNLHELFIFESVIGKIQEETQLIKEKITEFKTVLQLHNSPKINVGWHCNKPYPCDFIGHCWKNIPGDHLFKLEAFDKEKITELAENGTVSASQLGDEAADTPEQKRQLHALRNHTFVWDELQVEAAYQHITDAENLAFTCLFQRPAVPVIQHSKPYQALPLALACADDNNNQSFALFEGDYLKFINTFSATLIKLAANHTHLITDNSSDLIDFITESGNLLPRETYHELQSIIPQIAGLKQMLHTISFYHPQLNEGMLLEQLSEILLNEKTKLKEPTWLIHDILAADGEDGSGRIKYNLGTYLNLTQRIFAALRKLVIH